MVRWNAEQIQSLKGKEVIITGGSSGIGLETAKVLSAKGAEIVLAVRNMQKGEKTLAIIRSDDPDAAVSAMSLDLADLHSIEEFARQYTASHDRLHLLINNAGVMIPPYSRTKDGFELQFGTNHFGHFALTGHLLPLLLTTPLSRVVTVSSIASRKANIIFNNLDGSEGYDAMAFYRQSKLANLLFAIELQHRLERAGATARSIACHPGISVTNLISRGSGKETGWLVRKIMRIFAQPADKGALPTLYAATNPDLRGGEYIGPDGRGNHKGYPVMTDEGNRLYNQELATKLWELSENLTGIKYPV
jgi:NAD(P)-dependent dehydrogenase (short-subunit alcohol dehydrogenase family)